MADTRPTVAELVEKLHSNIDWISQIVLKLSDDTYNREIERLSLERESAIHSLREERVDALKKLLAERAVEKEETEIRRQREKEVIDEKRAREWEEISMRRKKEDLERIRILEIEDLEKERIRSEHDEERERQREEEERSLFEKCEDEIERLENEAQRKIEEGQAELKKLDEDRKIINQQIEAALSAPTVIPKITLRTRRPKTLDFSRAGTIEDLHKRSHTSLITPKSVTSKRDASSPGNNFEPDTGKFTPLFMNHENLDIHQTEECYRNQGKEEALPGLSAIKVSESMQSHDLQKEIFETNLRETSESEAHANEIFNGQKAEVFSNSFTSQLGNSSKKNDQQFHSNFFTQIFSGEISQNSVLSLSKNLSQNEVYKIETEKESPYECQISSKETSDCFDEKLDTSDISRDLKNLQTHSNTKKYNDNLVFTASKPQNFDTNGCSDEISSIKSSKRESKNEEVGDVDHKKHSSSIDIPECKNDFYISIPSSDKTSSMMPGLVSNPGISTGGNIKLTPASKEKEELNSMVNEIPNNLVAKKEAETLTHAFTEIETKTFSSNISLNSHETSNDFMELSNAFNSLNSIKKSEIISSTDQIPDILKESITFHTSNQKVLDSTTYERNLQTVNSNLDSTCQSFHSTENLGISSSQLFEIRTLKSEKESALKTFPYDNVNSLVLSSQDEGATKFYDLQNSQPSPSFDVHRHLTSDNYYVDSKYQIGENIPLASSYQIQAIRDTKDDMDQTDEKISPPLFNENASAFTSEIRISSTINKVISQSQDKSWCTNEVVNATEVIQVPEESGIKDTQISDAKTVESSYHEIEQESLDVSRVETSSSIIETIECSHDEEKVSEQSEEKSECTTEVVYTTEVIQISEEAEIKDTQISDAETVESSYHEIEQESLDISRVETSSSITETIESSHDEEKVSEQSEEKNECTTEVVYTTEVIQISEEAEIKDTQISDAETVESSYHEIEQESLDISRVETSSSITETIESSHDEEKVSEQSEEKSECTTEVVYTTEVIQISEEAEIKDTQISDAETVESSYHEIEQESLDISRVETSSSITETIESSHDEEKVSEQSEKKSECTTEVVYTTEVIQKSDAKTVESSYHEIEQESLDISGVETSSSITETIECSHDEEKVSEQSEEKSECTTEVVYTTEVIQISDAKTVESSYHEIEQESLDISGVETSSSITETIESSHDEEKVSEQSEEKSECTTEVVYTTEVIQISEEAEIKDTQISDAETVESSYHEIEQESLDISRVETSSSITETIECSHDEEKVSEQSEEKNECTTEVVYTTEVIQISEEAEIKDTQISDAETVESSYHEIEQESLDISRVETSSSITETIESSHDEEKVSEQSEEKSECTTEVVYTTEVIQISEEAEIKDTQISDAETVESSYHEIEQESLDISRVETSSSITETIESSHDEEKVSEQSEEKSECTTEVVYTTEVIQISEEAEIKDTQISDAETVESSYHEIEQESLDISGVETSTSITETIESSHDEEKVSEQSEEKSECTTEVVYTTEVIQKSDAKTVESSYHEIEQESLNISRVETSSSITETIESSHDEEKVSEQSEEKSECTTEVVYTTEVIQISEEAEIKDTQISDAETVESSYHEIEQESLDISGVETSTSITETIESSHDEEKVSEQSEKKSECTTEVVYTTEVIQKSDAKTVESSYHEIEQESLNISRVETSSSITETIESSHDEEKVSEQSEEKSECTTEVVYTTEVIQISEEAEIKDTQISDAETVESSYHEIEQESLDISGVETSTSITETIESSHDEEKVSEQSEEKSECTTEVVYTTEVIQKSDAKTVESSYHEIEQESLNISRVETSSSITETIESSHDEEKVSEQSEEKSECTTEVVYTTEVIQISEEAEIKDTQISDAETVESSYHEIEQESLDISGVETSTSITETIESSHDEEKVSEQSEEKSECTTEVVYTTEVIQKSDDGYSDVKDCTEEIKGEKNRIHDLRTSHGISHSSIIMECDPIDERENLTSTNEDNKCMAEIEETLVTGEWKNVISLDDVQILSMKNMIEDLSSASDRISFETEIDKIFTKGAETSKVGVDLRMSPSLRYKRNINRDLNALSGWDKTSIQNSNEISNAQPSSTLTSNLKISPNTEEIHPLIDSEFLSIAGKPKTLIYDEYQLCIDTINKRVPGLKRSPNPLETNDGPLKTDSIDLQNQVENTIDTVKLQNFNEPTLNLNHIHTSFVEAWSRKHHENNLDSELYEDKLPTSSVMEEFFDCYSDNSNYEFNPGQESEKEATNMEYIQSFLAMDEKPNDLITHEQSELSEGYRGDKDAKSKFQQNFDNLESISEVDEICDLSIIEDQTFSRSKENLNKTHQKSSDSSRYCFKADQEIFTDHIEDVQKINHRHESSLSISESIPTYKFSESTSTPTSPSEAPSSPFHENPIDEPIISSTWQGNMTGPGCMEAQDFKEFSTIVSKKSDICESHPISDQASSLENQVYLPDRPSEDNLTETPLTSKNLEQLMMQQKELSESNPDFSNTNKRYPISAQTSKIMIQQRIGNTNFHENSPTSSVNSSNILTKNNIQTKTTSPASSVKSFNLPSSPFQKARALFESQQQNKQQFKQNPTRPLSGFFAHRGVGLPAYSHSPSNLQLANFRSPIMEVNETREINEKIGDPSIVPLPNSPDCGSASALSSHSIHSISHPGTWSPQAQSKAAYRPNTPERSRLLFFENLQRSV